MFLGIPGLAHVGDQAGSLSRSCTHPDSCTPSKHLFSPQHIFPEPHVCVLGRTLGTKKCTIRVPFLRNSQPRGGEWGVEKKVSVRLASVQGALDPVPLKVALLPA